MKWLVSVGFAIAGLGLTEYLFEQTGTDIRRLMIPAVLTMIIALNAKYDEGNND